MANFTGYKQAVIARSFDAMTGEPLDAAGQFTRISGRPQAVRLLSGTPNPDPSLFEVVGYFSAGAIVDGESTLMYAPDECEQDVPVPWILDTGFWDNSAYWLNTGIWNY